MCLQDNMLVLLVKGLDTQLNEQAQRCQFTMHLCKTILQETKMALINQMPRSASATLSQLTKCKAEIQDSKAQTIPLLKMPESTKSQVLSPKLCIASPKRHN